MNRKQRRLTEKGAAKLQPGRDANVAFAEALRNHQAGRLAEAEHLYRRAIELKPDYAEAHGNRGAALQGLGLLEDAAASYRRAIALKPDYAQAYNNLAVALLSLGRLDEALASGQQALSLGLATAEVHFNLGAAFQALGRPDEAVSSYEQGLALKPGSAEVYFNMGLALRAQGRPQEALLSFRKALEIQPHHAEAHYEMGLVLRGERRLDESISSFRAALKANPNLKYVRGDYLHTRLQLCDWANIDTEIKQLLEHSERTGGTASPFGLSTLTDSAQLLRKAAEFTVSDLHPANPALGALARRPKSGKIRLGYFSSDYEAHPVAQAIVGILESHDRQAFELVAVSLGKDADDRIKRATDQFVSVHTKSDNDAALLSRDLGIDIAIDLSGLTSGCRPGIFSRRAAPIQVNYLGYGGTMGAEYFDYIIADKTLIPEQSKKWYSEKVLFLPNTCLPRSALDTARRSAMGDKSDLRKGAGLPAEGFVFCCFNRNYKILPDIFSTWMRILGQVDGSILWLLEHDSAVSDNLRREASARGIDPKRLIFAKRVPEEDYIRRYHAADLFLDTWPYTAGSIARECLWAGLPLLTFVGESYVSRMAASLLNVLELPELIASTPQQYESAAVELARNPARVGQIVRILERSRSETACFDTKSLTRNLEQGYAQMYGHYQSGTVPMDIYLANRT